MAGGQLVVCGHGGGQAQPCSPPPPHFGQALRPHLLSTTCAHSYDCRTEACSPEDALVHQPRGYAKLAMARLPLTTNRHNGGVHTDFRSPKDALVHQPRGCKAGQAAQGLAGVGGAALRRGRRQQAAVAHHVVDELAQRVACRAAD